MRRASTLSAVLLLSVAACDCGEKTAAGTGAPAQVGPAPVSPALSLAARCEDVISPADVQQLCGVQVRESRGGNRWDCERRFNPADGGGSRLVISAINELTPEQAADRFERMTTDAKGFKRYKTVEGLGTNAHSYYRTIGKGEGFRRMSILVTVKDTYVLRVVTAHHPESEPVCKPKKLQALSRMLLDTLTAPTK